MSTVFTVYVLFVVQCVVVVCMWGSRLHTAAVGLQWHPNGSCTLYIKMVTLSQYKVIFIPCKTCVNMIGGGLINQYNAVLIYFYIHVLYTFIYMYYILLYTCTIYFYIHVLYTFIYMYYILVYSSGHRLSYDQSIIRQDQ